MNMYNLKIIVAFICIVSLLGYTYSQQNKIETFDGCDDCSKYVEICNKINKDKYNHTAISWAGGVLIIAGVVFAIIGGAPEPLVLSVCGAIILAGGLPVLNNDLEKKDKEKNKIEDKCGNIKNKCEDKIESKGYKNVCSTTDYVKK